MDKRLKVKLYILFLGFFLQEEREREREREINKYIIISDKVR